MKNKSDKSLRSGILGMIAFILVWMIVLSLLMYLLVNAIDAILGVV